MGFFQVINHGVSTEAMEEMLSVCRDFFALPAEEKAALYSEDTGRATRIYSSTMFDTGAEKYWRECLRLACAFPDPAGYDDSEKAWPEKPARLREVVRRFTTQTRALGMEILKLLCEGLGLRPDYLEEC